VVDLDGTDLGKGSPEASFNLPEGTYTLKLRMVGRPILSGDFELTEALAWVCQPGAEQSATCTAGSQTLELAPQ
jgi:hypothetical protein